MKFTDIKKILQKKQKERKDNSPYVASLYVPNREPHGGQKSNMEEGVIGDTLHRIKATPGIKHALATADSAGRKAFKLRKLGPFRSKRNPFKKGSSDIEKKSGRAAKIHGAQLAGLAASPVSPYGAAGAALTHNVGGYIGGKMLHVGHMAHAAHATARTTKIKNWAKARAGKKGNRE